LALPCLKQEKTRMTSSFTRNAIVLGLLSAVGPFAIDMYLPALPSIAADLHATTATTQMTLTVFFIAFGFCQISYGPLSDVYGRKPPLYAGLALFTIGSIGCALAPNVGWLIACRFVQGAGAAAIAVIPRAVIRDLHTGVEATRLMALVMLVFSVSPILAPFTGSALIVPFGWRAVFVAVTVAALIGLLLTMCLLPETRPAVERIKGDFGNVIGGFWKLLCDRHFLGLTFIGGLGMASFFAFLSTSSFVYIGHYGSRRRNTAWRFRSMRSASSAHRNSRAPWAHASAWHAWWWRRSGAMRRSRPCCWG
jgi:DHA1 family bicyclomycin/chloramphenicol resistance-like MFS transporter